MKKIFFFFFPILLYLLYIYNLWDLIGTNNIIIIFGINIWSLGYYYNILINKIIILLPLLLWLFIFIFYNHLWKYFKYYFIFFSCFFLFFYLFLIINKEINLYNIAIIKLILSKWDINYFLQLLINDYIAKALSQDINILNIEVLNSIHIIENLTYQDRLFITSPQSLEIWFNNYTAKHVILDQNIQIIIHRDYDYIMYEILFKILLLSLIEFIKKIFSSKD
jgi:hypothetical protein